MTHHAVKRLSHSLHASNLSHQEAVHDSDDLVARDVEVDAHLLPQQSDLHVRLVVVRIRDQGARLVVKGDAQADVEELEQLLSS